MEYTQVAGFGGGVGIMLALPFYYIGLAMGQLELDYVAEEMSCPEANAKMLSIRVPWGVPGRAYLTLPPGLVIAPSKIHGFGIFSEMFIPKYTWLGEYEGEIVKLDHHTSVYTFVVSRNRSITACIDGYHIHLSSYHRYINGAMRYRDQNVVITECYGRIYYMTSKDVAPGSELLTYYGHSYSINLINIDINHYFDVPKKLLRIGLDLNNIHHQKYLEKIGIRFHHVKSLPKSWFYKVIGEMLITVDN